MLKKIASVFLGFALAFSLAACSSSSTSSDSSSESETVTDTTKTDTNTDSDAEAKEETQTETNTENEEEIEEEKEEDATVGGSVEDGQKYTCVISVEGYGDITLELDEGIAPVTVQNFVKLVDEGFYNGLTFHRIMDGFMIQGGDPNGNGTGGSDETIYGEFSDNGFDNTLSHTKGVISMARSSDPDSASSQFFICEDDATFLDGSYAAFGWVTDGMDVVEQIAEDAKPTDNNGTIPADEQPVITSITVTPIE